MKIDRERLLNDFVDFTLQGSGVVVGSPGVGKTYLLKELSQRLGNSGTPHLLLPIDQLGDGTDASLQRELSYQGDLIDKLKSIHINDTIGILLFDAFDAARNEETRQRFLRLIRSAFKELKGLWNVIVTVRTFDARKSQELLDLFENVRDADLTQYQVEGILCRHLAIPPLTQEEIRQAFDQIPHLKSIYESATQDLKSLLTNPFNLWLLEKILTTSHQIPDLSQIYSEVQLIDLFWQRRIGATSNEADRNYILTIVTRRMAEERSLNIRQEDVYESLTLGDNAMNRRPIDRAWNELLSDEILTKVSSTQQRIGFTHNILFDYAVSLLLIEDEPGQLEAFVLEDPSRPLFLRPSLTYFFTRLWYHSPESFWESFWRILPSDQSVQLRLFARLIPTSVIANEAREISQVEPLLEKLKAGEQIAIEAMVRLLQAYRMLNVERDAFWVEVFDCVSMYTDVDFVWDMATVTADILERARKTNETGIIATSGRIGRRVLQWAWREREINKENDWYNRFAGTCAVPLVVNTYDTNADESKVLLYEVLALTRQTNFPISVLMRLTMHIDMIWPHDPEFVLLVYNTVFTHYESSEETTELPLSGPVLHLTSTRRQDYKSCQYRLIKHFPGFLRASPSIATRAGVRSLNYFIAGLHIARYVDKGVTFEDLTGTFTFCGKTAHVVEDHSYIWDERNYQDQPIEIANELFRFIEEIAWVENSHSLLDSLLVVFAEEFQVALLWKRLLKAATKLPEIFAPRLYELCAAKAVLLADSLTFELGLFVETAAPFFTPEQRRKIEVAIVAIQREANGANLSQDTIKRRRDRLLARIPPDLLQTQEGKKIRGRMERTKQLPVNEPLFSSEISWDSYSDVEWLQKQGVDTTTPQNQTLQRFLEPLEHFRLEWRNRSDGPTENAVDAILPLLKQAYATIASTTGSDTEVVDTTLNKLAACVVIVSHVARKTHEDQYAFCRQVLLHCATHRLPEPDPEYDAKFDSPGYSPFPRHEAAHGLPRLITHYSDTQILEAIETLANDPVPSVRMVLAKELSTVYIKSPRRFWKIVENIAITETNEVVKEYIYFSLTQVVAKGKMEEDKTIRVMESMLSRTLRRTDSFEPSDSFTTLVIWLTINRENSWACQILQDVFFKEPVRFANFLTQVVYETTKYLNPANLKTYEGRETFGRGISWLERLVEVASGGVKQLCRTYNGSWNDDSKKSLRDTYAIIDGIIASLYFNLAHESDQVPKEKIPDELLGEFYDELKPLLTRVVEFALSNNGVMFAPTAHHFMELIRCFLKCNPSDVLHLAENVARSSRETGYNLDSLAVREVVKFVEIVLADHRKEVREGQALEDLVNLLDIFAEVGWTEALRVVWRLDEVFR